MDNDSNIDFNILFKKDYRELGINWLDSLESDDNYLINIMVDFQLLFPEIKIVNPYIVLLKTITFVVQKNSIELRKNDVYDFFIMSYKFLIDHLIKRKINSIPFTVSTFDNAVFEICNDLHYSYDKLNKNMKIQFPNLLVDVLSIIFFKADLNGKKVSLFQLKTYYESKRLALINNVYSYPTKDLPPLSNSTKYASKLVANQINDYAQHITEQTFADIPIKATPSHSSTLTNIADTNDEIINRLAQIVQRNDNEVKKSLAILPQKELQKLFDLCNNYNKIVKYSKYFNLRDFKLEIESELGRSLSDKQIRHSQISIKKVQFYIENILDGKFERHLTHGINHVKHNFEYGYRLIGLISNSKVKTKKNIS